MKDKLEKTGHKKLYYELKTALTVFMFILAVFALASIPVGISFKLAEAQAKAGETTSQVEENASALSTDSSAR
jgi:uncharacterized membrane protein SpoIIM required for sporulation